MRIRSERLGVIVVLAALALSGATASAARAAPQPQPGPVPTPPKALGPVVLTPAQRDFTKCPGIILYGVRGTNDTSFKGDNVGAVVGAVYYELQRVLPDVGMANTVYPAVGLDAKTVTTLGRNYGDSVTLGVQEAVSDLRALHADCATSQLALVGYSQGADVLRRALAQLYASGDVPEGSSIQSAFHIDGAYFLGDPNFQQGETVQQSGGYYQGSRGLRPNSSTTLGAKTGLGPQPNMPPMWWVEVCHMNDIICQGTGHHSGPSAHLNYQRADVAGVAWRMAAYRSGAFDPIPRAATKTPAPVAYIDPARVCVGGSPVARTMIWPVSPSRVSYNVLWDGRSRATGTIAPSVTPTAVTTRLIGGIDMITAERDWTDGHTKRHDILWQRTVPYSSCR
jgi:hypothetical protein